MSSTAWARLRQALIQARACCKYMFFLTLALFSIASPSQAIEPLVAIEEIVELEFPLFGEWAATNSLGILKWEGSIEVRLISDENTVRTRQLLALLRIDSEMPSSIQENVTINSGTRSDELQDSTDILIWVTPNPMDDLQAPLLSRLREMTPSEFEVEDELGKLALARNKAVQKFSFSKDGRMQKALLVIDSDATDHDQQTNLILQFYLRSFNPRISSEDYHRLFCIDGRGEAHLTALAVTFLAAIYSPKIVAGDSEETFRSKLRNDGVPVISSHLFDCR